MSFDFKSVEALFDSRKRELVDKAQRLRASEVQRRRRQATRQRREARLRHRRASLHTMVLRSHLSRVVEGAGTPGALASATRDALAALRGLCQCAACGTVAAPGFFSTRERCADCAMSSYTRDPVRWFAEHLAKDSAVRAQRVGVACDIDADWVSAALVACGRRCALCNGEMQFERRRPNLSISPGNGALFANFPLNASLDQREPHGGYTRDNVQLVHLRCNLAKMDMSQADFIAMCRAVASHHLLA
jgi:hypothetical protein